MKTGEMRTTAWEQTFWTQDGSDRLGQIPAGTTFLILNGSFLRPDMARVLIGERRGLLYIGAGASK